MIIDVTRLRQIEHFARQHGATTKRGFQPPIDDRALWSFCRTWLPDDAPDQPDADLLAAFRAAYHLGYQPEIVLLVEVVRRLRHQQVYAEVYPRGKLVELGAGRWPHRGTDGDPWPVIAGPGWTSGATALAHTDTFTITSASNPSKISVAAGTSPQQIADTIATLIAADPEHRSAAEQPTHITQVPFADSQAALGGDTVSLIYSGRDWGDTFLRQLNHLVDERLTDPEPHEGMRAVVFSGRFGDDLVTRTEGLIIAQHAGQLVFHSGDTVTRDDVLSLHLF